MLALNLICMNVKKQDKLAVPNLKNFNFGRKGKGRWKMELEWRKMNDLLMII